MNKLFTDNMICSLADENGTPLYLYSARRIRENYNKIFSVIPYKQKQIHYAVMCNSHLEILKVLRLVNSNVQINSLRELREVLKAGFLPENISLTTTNIGSGDMEIYARNGIQINFDSLEEVSRYGEVVKRLEQKGTKIKREIGIRIFLPIELESNNYSTNRPHLKKSRVGIKKGRFNELKKTAKVYGLKIVGVHGYLASNLFDLNYFEQLSKYLCQCAKEFSDLRYINFGSGFGVPGKEKQPEFDWGAYGKMIIKLIREINQHFRREIFLKIEPGRSLLADAGILVTKITNIKSMDTWTEVGVDSGFGVFARPLIYGWQESGYHEVYRVGAKRSGTNRIYTICGNSVLQGDFLAEDRLLPKLEVGDLLVFEKTGAYGSSMASLFPGRDRFKELVI